MKETKHIQVKGAQVLVRELTTGDMRAMLKAREKLEENIEPLELLTIGDGLLLSDLAYLTDLKSSQMESLTEAHIDEIVAASKELNPRFFEQILGTLSELARRNLAVKGPFSNAAS